LPLSVTPSRSVERIRPVGRDARDATEDDDRWTRSSLGLVASADSRRQAPVARGLVPGRT
jgi:hypothetical protein